MKYKLLIEGEAFRFLLSRRSSDRQMLVDEFAALAANPHRLGDFQETSEEGRFMEVFLKKNYLITFWADHAVKEVRVVRVEIV